MKRLFQILLMGTVISVPSLSLAQVQSPEVTQKFYPAPDVEFNTPTISIREDRFANYDEIISWLESREKSDPRMTIEYIGTSVNGHRIPMIHLNDGKSKGKVKVWIQGSIHGNEPAGAEAIMAMTDFILKDELGSKYLSKMDLCFLPIANIDGYLVQKRVSAEGFDLNRDQTKLMDKESIIIKKAFTAFNPEVAVDLHEFRPISNATRKVLPNGASYYDVLFLPSGYLNVPQILRDATDKYLRQPAEDALDKIGYTHHDYYTIDSHKDGIALTTGAVSPRSSSTSFALSNAISILVEFRGIGLNRIAFERRTNAAFTVIKSILDQTCGNSRQIKRIVREAIKRTIEGKDDIAVTFKHGERREDVTFLDLAAVEKKIMKDMLIIDGLDCKATLTRPRPKAYIIEKTEQRAIENLKILGVEVEILKEAGKMDVESYRITSCTTDDEIWEGIRRRTVTTQLVPQSKTFEAGTAIVWMNQENANFAVSVLEPESTNGFTAMRVVNSENGELLGIHRIK